MALQQSSPLASLKSTDSQTRTNDNEFLNQLVVATRDINIVPNKPCGIHTMLHVRGVLPEFQHFCLRHESIRTDDRDRLASRSARSPILYHAGKVPDMELTSRLDMKNERFQVRARDGTECVLKAKIEGRLLDSIKMRIRRSSMGESILGIRHSLTLAGFRRLYIETDNLWIVESIGGPKER